MANYNRVTLGQLKSLLTARLGNNSIFWVDAEKTSAINEALNVWQLMVGEFTTGITMVADGSTFYQVPAQIAAVQRIKFQPSPITTITTPASISLNTGLVSFWQLEEATGSTRRDSFGPNNLTPTNVPIQTVGKIGFGSNFTRASNQYLSILDGAQTGLNPGTGNFATSCWFFPTLVGSSTMGLIGKGCTGAVGSPSSSDEGYSIDIGGSTGTFAKNVLLGFSDGSGSGQGLACVFNEQCTFNAWNHLVVNFARTSNATAYLNGVQMTPGKLGFGAGMSDHAPSTGPSNPAAAFTIGSLSGNTFPPNPVAFFDGSMDAVGYWNRVLTTTEVAYLYNSGAGIQAPIQTTSTTQTFSNSPIGMISLNELDMGSPGWQGISGTPEFWSLNGINLFGLSPQPSSGVITIEGLSETPTLTNDGDYVMLGDEQLNRILDYAEHYCSFKEGVGEFDSSQSGFNLFIEAAAKRNGNLLATALYRQWMGRNREEQGRFSELPSVPGAR